MRIPKFLPVLLLMALLIAGCWDYTEYENMAMVFAIGIDINPNNPDELLLTIEDNKISGKGQKGGGGSDQTSISSGSQVHVMAGRTIPEALDRLQQIMDQQIFLGYTTVIVISESAIQNHLKNWLNFFDISPLVRSSVNVLITPGKALEVINGFESHRGKATSDKIIGLLNNSYLNGATLPVRLTQFFKLLSSEGVEPVAPRILVDTLPAPENGTGQSTMKKDEGPKPQKPQVILGAVEPEHGHQKISGMAAFDGYKFIGWLDETETRGLYWIKNQKLNCHYWVKAKLSKNSETAPLVFQVEGGKAKVKVKFHDGQPAVAISVKASAVVQEYNYEEDLIPSRVIQTMERILAAEIKNDIEATIQKAQQDLRIDILGIGFNMFQQHLREWRGRYKKRWTEVFPSVPIRVVVVAKVINTSVVGSSLKER